MLKIRVCPLEYFYRDRPFTIRTLIDHQISAEFSVGPILEILREFGNVNRVKGQRFNIFGCEIPRTSTDSITYEIISRADEISNILEKEIGPAFLKNLTIETIKSQMDCVIFAFKQARKRFGPIDCDLVVFAQDQEFAAVILEEYLKDIQEYDNLDCVVNVCDV